ncbi:hypothetical protein [Duganella sp. Root198D2]|uniref:hypothetical protein n=1 Tax=Duganella sp. Root198D2 TaxID=1736489 RepID=UPI000A3E9BFB|nr:hypothetical protein [Duganella sp. Root198D2]
MLVGNIVHLNNKVKRALQLLPNKRHRSQFLLKPLKRAIASARRVVSGGSRKCAAKGSFITVRRKKIKYDGCRRKSSQQTPSRFALSLMPVAETV